MNLEEGDKISLTIESSKVIRKELDSIEDVVEFLSGFEDVKRFSYDGEVFEVVLDE